MTHIEPLAPADIRDPEIQRLIGECERLGVPDARFPRILARAPDHARALLRALLHSHAQGNVDHKLKEIIRIQLARTAGSGYFGRLRSGAAAAAGLDEETITAALLDFENSPRFSAAEKWAMRYADLMYRDAHAVDAAFYTEMKQHYTEAQIMELGAFIAFHYGMQVFMRTLETTAE